MLRLSLIAVLALVLSPAVAAQDPPPLFTDYVVLGTDALVLPDAAWGDLDADGDLDLVLIGGAGPARTPTLRILFQTGDTVAEQPNPSGGEPITVPAVQHVAARFGTPPPFGLWRGSVILLDFDGDGDLDIAASGIAADGRPKLQIVENQGATGFVMGWSQDGTSDGDIEAVDIDGDGDTDLVLTGMDAGQVPVLLVYENRSRDGAGFVARPATATGASNGSLSAADFDRDGDADLLLSGHGPSGAPIMTILRNDGGQFVPVDAGLPALFFPFATFGDADADGDPDILAIGARPGPTLFRGANVFLENRGAVFLDRSELIAGRFSEERVPGRYRGSAGLAEVDGDGLPDLFVTGSIGKLRNDPGGFFVTAGNAGWNLLARDQIIGGLSGRTYAGDHDGDGDVDILTVGESASAGPVLRMQRNTAPRPDIGVLRRNRVPRAPIAEGESVNGSEVLLTWRAGSDPETPVDGLTYEVRLVLDGAVSVQIVPALSIALGRRLMARPGNAGSALSMRVKGLAPGTYRWAVQTIDAAMAGSQFSLDRTFTVR